MADHTIDLNAARDNFALPNPLSIKPGKTVNFSAVGGNFCILIRDAINIFEIESIHLKVRIEAGHNSVDFTIKDEPEKWSTYYEICLEGGVPSNWPDAPPRIIVAR